MKERNSQTGIALKLINGNLTITPRQQPGRRLDDAEYQLLTELV